MNLPSIGNRGSEDKAQIYTIGASRAIAVAFPQIRTIGMWRPPDGYNEHSSGMAADVMIPDWNTPQGRMLGDAVCEYALTLQGVDYVIWLQAMHYRNGRVTGMPNRGSPTQNHMDHNHVHTTGGGYPKPGQVYTAHGTTSTIGGRYWPLGVGRVVTSPFGPRDGGFHAGVDFGRAGGSADMPVFACQGGEVIKAGAAQGYGGPDPAGWLVVDHSDADGAGCTEYGHIIREVAIGQRVEAGQRIGHINPNQGTNGGVSPHLHLALMPREYNSAAKIDPLPWLNGAREPGGAPPPSPPPLVLSRTDRYALIIMEEGRKLGITPRGQQIALCVGLVETTDLKNYANSNDPPSLNLPHDAVGSDHMSVGVFQQQPNWGSRECRMDIACAARLFYTCDNGPGTRGLTKIRERVNGRDGALYDYNSTSHSPGFYAQKVQGSAFPTRYDERFGQAVNLYNRLVNLTPPTPPPGEDDFLMALSAEEQQDVLRAARNQLAQRKSRSPLRELDEGTVGDSDDQIWDMDSSIHLIVVFVAASIGVTSQLGLLHRIAAADPIRYPDRQPDRLIAQAMLAEIADNLELKQGILEALGRVTANTTYTATPVEVLPAVRYTDSVSMETQGTPEEMLSVVDRAITLQGELNKRLPSITKLTEELQ